MSSKRDKKNLERIYLKDFELENEANHKVLPDSAVFGIMPEEIAETSKKKGNKKRNAIIVLSTCLIVLLVAILIGFVMLFSRINAYADYDKIFPNVYCAGINLGGMTKDEAIRILDNSNVNPEYSVKIVFPDYEYEIMPSQEGTVLNSADVVEMAYRYGRSDDRPYRLYKAYKAAKETTYNPPTQIELSYDSNDIWDCAMQISEKIYYDPTESYVELDEETHTVNLTIGNAGRSISPETIYNAVCDAFNNLDFSDIELSYELIDIDYDNLYTICSSAADYSVSSIAPVVYADTENHTIEITKGTSGWSIDPDNLYLEATRAVSSGMYGETIQIPMDVVEPETVDITLAYEELACEPKEPYYVDGSVHEGIYGYSLDFDAVYEEIISADYGEHLSIPMTATAPTMTAEEVQSVLFRDTLSSYDTAHTAVSNRTTNLTLACEAINGTVINPGEEFSFNNTVGERTADKGYKAATVYVGTNSEEELGGGVCQVASTIYVAALMAEMEITQREPHTFFVTYVPGGLDATVYWGSVDFKFKNSTNYPIRINASVSGGYVHISIDGTKTNDHVVEFGTNQLSSTPYSTVYQYSSYYKRGTQITTVTPYTGYTYDAYQYIYDGEGNLIETNYLGVSTYQKRDQVITIGTG